MKIGLLSNHWSYRQDLKLVIAEMVKGGDSFVLFSNEKLPIESEGVIVRGYQRIESFHLKILRKIYFYFREIPRTRINFHLMELFRHKLLEDSSEISFSIAYFIRSIRINIIRYDWYLKILASFKCIQMDIADVDCFVLVSDIPSDDFAAVAHKSRKPVFVLVYSWDHIYKYTRFPIYFKYLVWSHGLKEDLAEMWGVKITDIFVLGPLAFYSIAKTVPDTDEKSKLPNNYILFCFSTGLKELIDEEIGLVLRIRDYLLTIGSAQTIVCRLYPVISNWDIYERLYKEDGVSVVSQDNCLNGIKVSKNSQIKNARLVIHSGSTIGVEAILLGVNSVMIDLGERSNLIKGFKNKVRLRNHIYQYQNTRFLPKEVFLNSVAEISRFNESFQLREFNSGLINEFNPKTIQDFSKDFAKIIWGKQIQ